MPLFDVVVIEHPTKKDREDNDALERIILGPVQVIAKSGQGAAFKVTVEYSEKLKTAAPDRTEMLVRPFA